MLWLLNYFWLSFDPIECASWYCDQHCFKIGSEVIESVWDAILELYPDIEKEADKKGLPKTNRKRRHSKPDSLWHPLSVWNAICKANMKRSLINADAIFKEHLKRTGKSHQAWKDCEFLMQKIDSIDFNTRWKDLYESQSCIKKPSKTPEKDVDKRKKWFEQHLLTLDTKKSILKQDKNICNMTEPPQCINETLPSFVGCKVEGDVIRAYRKYYIAKASTVSGGMRYFYSTPPLWLSQLSNIVLKLTRQRKNKKRFLKDEDGFVVIKLL